MQKKEEYMVIPDRILHLMQRLEQFGEEAYLVGGSLRDLLLALSPNDYDIATSSLPEKTMEIFSDHRVITTGLKHGTVTVLADGDPVEITTFRIDGSYSDARHPDQVIFTKRIEEDLSRRDFTVNAMAYHPNVGLVDPFGGREDLKRKMLRAVGTPSVRFEEDALRILRAFRFSAQLGFEIEEKTLEGCCQSKYGLTKVAKERIATEFLKLLLSRNPAMSLQKMMETEVLNFVVEGFLPSEQILREIFRMPTTDTARLGFLFSEWEEETIKQALGALKYSKKQITGTCAVARGAKEAILTPADARRLRSVCGVYAEEACLASILLHHSPEEALVWIREKQAPSKISDLKISGTDLMALGFSGKEIGITLQTLLSLVIEDPTRNEKEILLDFVKKNINS